MGRGDKSRLNHGFSILLCLFGLNFSPQDSVLTVVVRYDPDHDGIEEGVGPGIPVYVGSAGSETLNFTDENSEAHYLVVEGVWLARAEVPSTHPFLVWVCGDYIVVDELMETLTIHCRQRFRISFPWLSA